MNRRQSSVGDIVKSHGELVDAESALAGDVEEVRGEGDVEVCGVCSQAEVDEEVGPGVVKFELDGASFEGPVGDVAGFVGNSAAYFM